MGAERGKLKIINALPSTADELKLLAGEKKLPLGNHHCNSYGNRRKLNRLGQPYYIHTHRSSRMPAGERCKRCQQIFAPIFDGHYMLKCFGDEGCRRERKGGGGGC